MSRHAPLWLVRHAPTSAPSGQVVGHLDVPLSAEGEAAADQFAEAFAKAWMGDPPMMFTSDLARAQATVAPLAARWGCLPRHDHRLREVHFGDWEGQTWEAVGRDDGAALNAWMSDWVNTPPPGGESFRMLLARVEAWLADCVAQSARPALVVAHAGALRALVCAALGLPPEAAFGVQFDHLRLARLDRQPGGGWTLALLGARAAHIHPVNSIAVPSDAHTTND
ncbi:MAG: histidine phosphatase family protein [Bacteroidota bacterium]